MSENGKISESLSKKKVKDKTESLLEDLKEKGKSLLSQGIESARDIYDEQSKVVKKKAGEFQDKSFEEISEDVKVFVRRNPLKSIGIAVGVGVLLSMIFRSDD